MIFSIADQGTSTITMAARRLPSELLTALLAFGLLVPLVTTPAQADIQRMRLPAGSYFISGGGGGYYGTVRMVGGGGGGPSSLGGGIYRSPGSGGVPARAPRVPSFPPSDDTSYIPARCIDGSDDPPDSSTTLFGAGNGLVVRQVQGKNIVAEKPLHEAISGPDKWLEITGTNDGSYKELAVRVLEPGYDYFLEAPTGAIFADSESLASTTAQAVSENAGLSAYLTAADQLEGDFAALSSGNAEQLLDVKQKLEWELFADSRPDPTSIGTIGVDSDRQAELLQLLVPSDDTERLASLVMHADSIDDQFLDSVLQIGRFKNPDGLAPQLQALQGPTLRSKLDFLKGHAFFEASSVLEAARRGMPITASLNAALFAQYDDNFWLLADPYVYAVLATPAFDSEVVMNAVSRARTALLFQNDELSIPPPDRYAIATRFFGDRITIRGFGADGKHYLAEFTAPPTVQELAEAGIADGTILLVNSAELGNDLSHNGHKTRLFHEELGSLRLSAFDKTETDDGIQFTRQLPSNTTLQYLSLGNVLGDTILVETPIDDPMNSDLLVIDTGNNGDAFINSIKSAIARRGGNNKVRLLITHTDADHIRGAQKMLQDPSFDVQEVIIGHGATLSVIARNVRDLLDQDATFERGLAHGNSILHYVKKGTKGAVELQQEDPWGSAVVRLLVRGRTAYVDLYQMKQPQSTNDSGFIVRVSEAGSSHLLTDDATARSLGAYFSEESLRTGVLKWPHHLWFPASNASEMELLKQVVQEANPHTIVLTNRGHGQPEENAEKISAFVKEVLGREVRVIWTKPTGRVTISMLRNGRMFNELAYYGFYNAPSAASFSVPTGSPVSSNVVFLSAFSNARQWCQSPQFQWSGQEISRAFGQFTRNDIRTAVCWGTA